jgi:hypothetical protein
MSLTKYWVYKLYPVELVNSQDVYLASDVDALLDDPQALAALLVERAGKMGA